MIKIPKEVKNLIKTLEDAGFKAYAAGECVRDSLAGLKPYDWDLATSAGFEDLKNLFPDAEIVSEKYSVIRKEFVEETYDSDGVFSGEEGLIVDIGTFRKDNIFAGGVKAEAAEFADTIEEDLSRRAFTADAVADNGTGFVDIAGGYDDIKKKLVKTTGNPDDLFKEDPARMLRAIRIAAELDFDLAQNVYESICANYRLLEKISVDRFRNEFVRIMSAAHAGKGLNMIMSTGILNIILGDDAVARLTKREKSDMMVLCQNIDRSKQVEARRLGLFYTIIDKKKALPSIEKFNFDEVTNQYLVDACHDMPKLYFAQSKELLKKFIYKHGMDRYNYLANLEKAQRIVFDYDSETKIKSKMYLLEEIHAMGEAIFVDDLAVDGNDLIEAGICETPEEAEKMLSMLVEKLHIKPNLNTRTKLLELAKTFKRNKLAAATRGIRWFR
ncbi:MAG: CCA tRNA nucleotidyltransferase [Firmicutes bacterium]|nr:CCA tRNA nucleotidyltransferase [Bacillota bacterium]